MLDVSYILSLLFLLAILAFVCWGSKWMVGYMEVPQPGRWIILVVVLIACLLAFLCAVGLIKGCGVPLIAFPSRAG